MYVRLKHDIHVNIEKTYFSYNQRPYSVRLYYFFFRCGSEQFQNIEIKQPIVT